RGCGAGCCRGLSSPSRSDRLRRMRALAAIAFAVGLLLGSPAFADKSADAYYKEALEYKQKGKLDDAIKSLESAVQQNPKHGMAWASLGSLYKQKNDLTKAIDAFEHATLVITKDKTLWRNLGTAYASADKNDQAKTALLAACKLDPKDAEVRYLLGTVQR